MVKARRAEKLVPEVGLDKAEAESLRRVSRSVRGEPERVDETAVRDLRKRLDTFFCELQNESLPATNPVKTLREMIGISQTQMASTCYYSYSRWREIENGGISVLPNTFVKMAVDLFGATAASVFEKAWVRFRASLSEAARRAAERRLFPLGSGGMAP